LDDFIAKVNDEEELKQVLPDHYIVKEVKEFHGRIKTIK